ncbi:hypothetical protein QVD17_29164 [Tagetes erecta]|uniref:peroxidase n=1 Tax=Tagetes erecta TaxID=13708 RepID=A0AAD8NT85_TARER|nr:hypothetical protein QVD17_29164 [Tagetes erecta]
MQIRLTIFIVSFFAICCVKFLHATDPPLSLDYYKSSCPNAEAIVRKEMECAVLSDPRNAALILRLHFHDCFVQGCDGSVLLDDTITLQGEKKAPTNLNALKGFEIIDRIKNKLESECPITVSCADALTYAARDATVLVGGPYWDVPAGRKDSKTASFSLVESNLPGANDGLLSIIAKFMYQGLSVTDMVALSGAHTIGKARCTNYRARIYGDYESTATMTSITESNLNSLKSTCPAAGGGDNNEAAMDYVSPNLFDNSYYQLLLRGEGLLNSDQELYSSILGVETRKLVKKYAVDPVGFFEQFAKSMVKLGNITNPETYVDGEVRKNCRFFQFPPLCSFDAFFLHHRHGHRHPHGITSLSQPWSIITLNLNIRGKMHTEVVFEEDYISDLPQSIIETILTKLPIRDAVRTSVLSNKWRYKWATLTQLEFDDKCVPSTHDRALAEVYLINFVTRFLFLHDGPIHRFSLSTVYLQSSADVDQWLLFLSRKDVKELVLELGEGEWFRAPSCLFSCKKLVRLELVRCELDPPVSFKGFLNLKYLNLQQVLIAPDAVENLISCCPLLESLTLSYFDSLELTIRAPNLKYLILEGEFKDICLENTPMLVAISVAMYMTDDIAEHFGQSSSCNFDKFLGGVPSLERLIGHIYFTKYMSIGNALGSTKITYQRLKVIELYQVSFEDMKEIMVVLRLILSAPNLQELQISGSSNSSPATEATDLDFWEKECPGDCTFERLKIVKMTDMSGVPHEMGFIEFLLGNSPILEIMSITPSVYVTDGRLGMLIELLRLKRASAEAEIIFVQDQV